jgi:hypothetical protein
MSTLTDVLTKQLGAIRDAGTYKNERVIVSPQAATIGVAGSASEVLNFCANNYLGLANHPEIVRAAKEALETHGYGLSSVRYAGVCVSAVSAWMCSVPPSLLLSVVCCRHFRRVLARCMWDSVRGCVSLRMAAGGCRCERVLPRLSSQLHLWHAGHPQASGEGHR